MKYNNSAYENIPYSTKPVKTVNSPPQLRNKRGLYSRPLSSQMNFWAGVSFLV